MSIVSAVVVYLLAWWLVLFTILPWGNRPDDDLVTGHAGSAPAKPRLKVKFLVTSVIAAIILLGVHLLLQADVIDFYSEAAKMAEEDFGG